MPYEVRYLRESVVTALMLAHVRFLFIVDALMLLQAGILNERVATLGALIRSLSCVGPQVLLERLLTREELAAALVGALKVSSLSNFGVLRCCDCRHLLLLLLFLFVFSFHVCSK